MSIKENYREKFILAFADSLKKLTKAKGQEDFARQNIEDVEWGYKTKFTPIKDDTADNLLAETLAIYTNLTIGECKKVVATARKSVGNISLKINYDPTAHLVDIYYAVARAAGYSEDDIETELNYDCRKIDVAKDIQSQFFAACEAEGLKDFEIGTAWCLAGPKTNEELSDGYVKLSYGFFTKREMSV